VKGVTQTECSALRVFLVESLGFGRIVWRKAGDRSTVVRNVDVLNEGQSCQ